MTSLYRILINLNDLASAGGLIYQIFIAYDRMGRTSVVLRSSFD